MRLVEKLNVLSLHGVSGSGKDTLATFIHGNTDGTSQRLSFGDELRKDVCQVLGMERPPIDERALVPGFDKSFKDFMVWHGRTMSLSDPYFYTRKVCETLDRISGTPSVYREVGLLVCTDCRRPVEFEMLRSHPNVNLWAVRLPPRDNLTSMPLDHLLLDYRGIRQLMSGTPDDYLEQVTDHLISSLPLNIGVFK